jgi:hypothetical protein
MISVIVEYNGTTMIETHPLNGYVLQYIESITNWRLTRVDYIVFLHWLVTT